jgi:hypothetical protein
MPRPGSDVVISDVSAPGGPSLNTGQAFFVGVADSGPADAYSEIRSMKAYKSTYGTRTGGPLMFDAVNAFFQEGGGTAFVSKAATADAAGVGPALDAFNYELGPGQVCAPGLTDPLVHAALLGHVNLTHRCALLDSAGGDEAALDAEASALYSVPGSRFGALLAPKLSYPVLDTGAPANTPYSGVQAGMIARADAVGNPNQPAAGVNGISRLALGLSTDYTDDERETLNAAGVTLAKLVYGDVRTYGARTIAGPDDENWLWFANSRVVMAVTHRADAIAQNYVFKQVDGRRQLFAKLETELRGMLLDYYAIGALYGASPAEAFSVDTGAQINTDETIAAGEVHASIRLKTSPTGEWVQIEIVKVALELPVAA